MQGYLKTVTEDAKQSYIAGGLSPHNSRVATTGIIM